MLRMVAEVAAVLRCYETGLNHLPRAASSVGATVRVLGCSGAAGRASERDQSGLFPQADGRQLIRSSLQESRSQVKDLWRRRLKLASDAASRCGLSVREL